ncbi:hypothetical protein E1B25_15230 [Antarcticimicrobium sediminis]|uniref:Uncharacterized protein n=1 Tax=Antarcticimicrobium sediminis TaxID=2546227 RepID=A0A4R5ENS2_9RHOB|nr:hypothetical protein E1B25_15230 [Antarcticimicrobium sediminis]
MAARYRRPETRPCAAFSTPSRTKTLPLTALRTFEAAARLGGFAAAAQRLEGTQGLRETG